MTVRDDTPRATQAHTPRPRPTGIDLDTAQLAIERAHAITELLQFWWAQIAREISRDVDLPVRTIDTALLAVLAELEVAAQCLTGAEVQP